MSLKYKAEMSAKYKAEIQGQNAGFDTRLKYWCIQSGGKDG